MYIDAYNLIYAAMRRMRGFEMKAGETEIARERLLGLLQKYRTVRQDRIVVFFDGGHQAAHLPRHAVQYGMDIQFSDADSNADSDIENAVSHADNPRSIRVVTSDTGIQAFVKRYGAQVVEANAFLTEISETLEDHSIPADEPIEKYEDQQSEEETEYWLNIFGEEPEDEDA